MPNVEVCLTPELLHLYELENKIVVIVDIFRATTCIVSGIGSGIKGIMPVETVEECRELQKKGYLAAAEREGEKVEGFDIDNSPFNYMDASLKDKTIAMTTTNGTLAIAYSKETAYQVIIGAFINHGAVLKYLQDSPQDAFIFCAGWKGKINMEDTLFAGSLLTNLEATHEFKNDACRLASNAFLVAKDNMEFFLQDASHYQRLIALGRKKDIEYCLTFDQFEIIPILKEDTLVKM